MISERERLQIEVEVAEKKASDTYICRLQRRRSLKGEERRGL